jgi:hypothetical protein
MNLGFFGSLACLAVFMMVRDLLYVLGKPKEPVLYWILEPICILFRIAWFAAYAYYGFWLRVPKTLWLIGASQDANTWKKPDEPFLTNASLVNAFFAWVIFILFWFVVGYFALAAAVLLAGTICGGSVFRRKVWGESLCPGIWGFLSGWLPMAIRRYVWGLS